MLGSDHKSDKSDTKEKDASYSGKRVQPLGVTRLSLASKELASNVQSAPGTDKRSADSSTSSSGKKTQHLDIVRQFVLRETHAPVEVKESQSTNPTHQVGRDREAYFKHQFLTKLAEQKNLLHQSGLEKIDRHTPLSKVPMQWKRAFAIARGMTIAEKVANLQNRNKNTFSLFLDQYTSEIEVTHREIGKMSFLVKTFHKKISSVEHLNRINYSNGTITAEKNTRKDLNNDSSTTLHNSAIFLNQFLYVSKKEKMDTSQFILRQVRREPIHNQETQSTLNLIAPLSGSLLKVLNDFYKKVNSNNDECIDVDSIIQKMSQDSIDTTKITKQFEKDSDEYFITYQFGERNGQCFATYRYKKENGQCFATYKFEKGSDGYLSILGTPNAYGVLYLLKEYTDTFGDREVTSIEVERSIDHSSPSLIFHIDAVSQGSHHKRSIS